MNWLVGESGSLSGRRIEVSQELIVGRAGADLDIDDAEISRRHAAIRPAGDGIEVEDLGSTNGTWVNDARISGRRQLEPGDALRLGGTVLRVPSDRAAPVPAASPPPPGPPLLAPAPAAAPAFASGSGRRRAATRSYLATTIVIAVIVADAIALIVYFAAR